MKFIIDGTANIVMHPARFKILQHLRQNEEKQFVEQISKAINIHPRMVSHHLDVLQDEKMVECSYELVKISGSKRGVAVRLCSVTPKAEEVLQDIRESTK